MINERKISNILKSKDIVIKDQEDIIKKRKEYKKEYNKLIHIIEKYIIIKNLDIRVSDNTYCNSQINKLTNKAQILLLNYELLDPEILPKLIKLQIKESLWWNNIKEKIIKKEIDKKERINEKERHDLIIRQLKIMQVIALLYLFICLLSLSIVALIDILFSMKLEFGYLVSFTFFLSIILGSVIIGSLYDYIPTIAKYLPFDPMGINNIIQYLEERKENINNKSINR